MALGAMLLLAFMSLTAFAQTNKSGYPDVARQRLLIRITAQYIHTISQGQVDMDSAVRIPCKLYGLSPLLAYNEGYSNGTPSAGSKLIDAGKIAEARMLLAKTQGAPRLQLLAELGAYLLFKPGVDDTDIAEATKYINEAVLLSGGAFDVWRLESSTLKAQLLAQTGHDDESRKLFEDVVKQASQMRSKNAYARALLNAGQALHYGDPARLKYFEDALRVNRQTGNKPGEIEALSLVNIEYFVAKRYDVAERMLVDVVKLARGIKFTQQQYPYDGLAYLAYRNGHLTQSLEYSNKSLESLRSKPDSALLSFFYTRKALLLERLMKQEEALLWYDKALAAITPEVSMFWFRPVVGKVSVLNILGKPAKALQLLNQFTSKRPPTSYFEKMHIAYLTGRINEDLKRYPLAEENYNTFLAMAANFPKEYMHDEFPSVYAQISGFYRVIGNTKRARELLEIAKEYTSDQNMQGTGNYYHNLFKIDSTEKRYLPAIRDLQKSYDIIDSVYSYDQIKKTRELLIKYEAEKKDNDIKLLNTKNQVAQLTAAEANRTKNRTLAGSVLLGIIIVLLIWMYIIKRNANRKLEANQRELDQKNTYLESINTDKDKLLKEKEWLLKEVHHRVKNNLQMVTGLLLSQSVYLKDKASVMAIKDSLRRMQAISIIHQKLYQDENTDTIAMPEYFADLVRYLHESFDAGNQIIFKQDIEEIDLDVSQAIPLGLIVTESIVNAIKYAFLHSERGVVDISLKRDGETHLVLKVSDNGTGLPEGIEASENSSLGLGLIQGLAKQLNGDFKIENNNGVHITVKFRVFSREQGQGQGLP
ncbi:histidine kinase [Mucilaginibacter pedocola]|uniref:histidine kinase n=2 Tax=Mucilaginibacter pedocola TaxID=1792845 RepID=A0A1S9P7L8_9SPHI|nr:histidine kinase [Mucilaginibacter pedocola]